MALVRAQTKVAADSTLARDYTVMTTHFNVQVDPIDPPGDADYQQLADDLLAIWTAWHTTARHWAVTLYDLDDALPRAPRAIAEANVGVAPVTNFPREMAVCLSFFADRSRPRQRGRIYVPAFLVAGLTFGLRPNQTGREKVLALADSFSGLGGLNVDWCVYSRTDNQFRKVTHAWVDDEWDVQRRRGLRASARSEKDVSG